MHLKILPGIFHTVPDDMQIAIESGPEVLTKWNSLTPIQRNEWICWTTIVKQAKTRTAHIDRMLSDLTAGKRSPCCWPGCPHRKGK
jgi:uncharacterized protein YdeI (YjbR/CyaY-like superfamily)